jgi:ribosomal-protein-alanine N-acetyltransferase
MLEADLAQVRAIDERSFPVPWPKNAYRFELLENENGHCWVAEVEGQLVGQVVFWLIIDEAHIATLAIDPHYRGLGLGKQLIATGLKALIPQGAEMATLEVRAGNQVAQSLYHFFGFRVVGRRKEYYRDNNEDALLMTVTGLNQDYLGWLRHMSAPWSGNGSDPAGGAGQAAV